MADILVLTTGGTVDKLYFDALSEYQIGASVVPRLLSIARAKCDFRIVELMRKDSLDLTAADRALIVDAVLNAPEARIVITHGTDTMVETARELAAVPEKCVALVGALAPAHFAESDAAFNLGLAFDTVQVAPKGIWIAMNGTIFAADHVRKDRALNAFVGHHETSCDA